jgi:hypothetical protein
MGMLFYQKGQIIYRFGEKKSMLIYYVCYTSTQRVLYNTFNVTTNNFENKNSIGMLLGKG